MYDRRSGLLLWHTMAEAPVGVPQGLYAMLGDPDVTDRLRRSGVDVAALERAAETHRSAPGSEKAWRDALPCPEPFDIGNPAHVGSVTVEGLLGALLAQPDLAAVWARVGRPEPLAPTAPLAPVTGPHLVVWRDDETPFGFLVELLHEALDISRFEAMRAAVRVDAEGLARVSVPTRVVLEQAVALIREIAGMAGYPLRVEVGSAIGGVP